MGRTIKNIFWSWRISKLYELIGIDNMDQFHDFFRVKSIQRDLALAFAALVGVRILINSIWKGSKIPHVDPEVGFENDGPFWTMKSQMEQWAKGVRVYTYPVVKLFGANINTYAITDYDMAKELMVKSNALGVHEG